MHTQLKCLLNTGPHGPSCHRWQILSVNHFTQGTNSSSGWRGRTRSAGPDRPARASSPLDATGLGSSSRVAAGGLGDVENRSDHLVAIVEQGRSKDRGRCSQAGSRPHRVMWCLRKNDRATRWVSAATGHKEYARPLADGCLDAKRGAAASAPAYVGVSTTALLRLSRLWARRSSGHYFAGRSKFAGGKK